MKRRRFLFAVAAAGIVAARPSRAFRLEPVEWRGVALGAPATLILHHEDRTEALRLVEACVAEVTRLERVFSLYRPDSVLVRLNRDGRLAAPPFDLLALLDLSDRFWRQSGGAFDPTVQPLWQLHARHFAAPGADPAGPPAEAVAEARSLVGWQNVRYSADAIRLGRPGMALTLNGIAQGYITDKITQLLRSAGMRHALVDMGEIAAVGPRGDGRPWRVGLPGDGAYGLSSGALAVSDPDGTRFSPRCHHIFDPFTGGSAATIGPVIRRADSAAEADAMATAAAVDPRLDHSQ